MAILMITALRPMDFQSSGYAIGCAVPAFEPPGSAKQPNPTSVAPLAHAAAMLLSSIGSPGSFAP